MAEDEKRRRIYEEIWHSTQKMVQVVAVPAPFQEFPDQYEVTLIHQPTSLATELASALNEATQVAPWLSPMPLEKLHVTLFNLYLDKPAEFFKPERAADRRREYEVVTTITDRYGVIPLRFEGLNLTVDGTLIVQGFDVSGRLDALRKELTGALPDPERRDLAIIHVSLARLKRPIKPSEFKTLADWVGMQRGRLFPDIPRLEPVLKATRDREGAVDHPAGEAELKLYYGHRHAGLSRTPQ